MDAFCSGLTSGVEGQRSCGRTCIPCPCRGGPSAWRRCRGTPAARWPRRCHRVADTAPLLPSCTPHGEFNTVRAAFDSRCCPASTGLPPQGAGGANADNSMQAAHASAKIPHCFTVTASEGGPHACCDASSQVHAQDQHRLVTDTSTEPPNDNIPGSTVLSASNSAPRMDAETTGPYKCGVLQVRHRMRCWSTVPCDLAKAGGAHPAIADARYNACGALAPQSAASESC